MGCKWAANGLQMGCKWGLGNLINGAKRSCKWYSRGGDHRILMGRVIAINLSQISDDLQ
jgi:hypothetical protein